MPRAVLESVREYRREMDVISAFVEDCCVEEGSVSAKTLYAAYCQWADDNHEYRMSNTKFGIEMTKKYEKIHTMNGWFYNKLSLVGNDS